MKLTRLIFTAVLGVLAGTVMVPSIASAHTVQICWEDDGAVTKFYAGSYHQTSEGPSPIGGIIVDGFEYPFSGWILKNALPATAHCRTSNSPAYQVPGDPDPDGVAQASVIHYQTFTSVFPGGPHTVSFTSTNVVQTPIGTFPQLNFGGGACADADFDGLCNNVDACPLDAENDGDGDGRCANVDNCPLDSNANQLDTRTTTARVTPVRARSVATA